MRRFGGSTGMGSGGPGSGSGGGAGGGMFRTVSRVARAGMSNLQDPSSPTSSSASNSPRNASKRGLILSNTATAIAPSLVSLSNSVQGFGPAWPFTSSSSLCDESEWECVHEEFTMDDENESFDARVFGSVPSPTEVTSALLSLQQALPTSRSSDMDWIEPSWHVYGNDQSVYPGVGRVYDALHLLQTDPSVQRTVISLSNDRAVWDAILNNEAVRALRESFYNDEAGYDSESSGEESDHGVAATSALSWIFNNMRSKLMEFLSGITDLMKEAFQPAEQQQQTDDFPDGFGEKVRAAFVLTAIVLLIVVVSRATQA